MANHSHEVRALIIAAAAAVITIGGTFGAAAVARQLFRTGDTSAAANAAGPGAPDPAASAVGPHVVAQGKTLFAAQCATCHGDAGAGGYGPDLQHRVITADRLTSVISRGVNGKMPSFATRLKPADIQAIVAYIGQSVEQH